MVQYKSKSGKSSGVTGYELGEDFIIVSFREKKYKYTESLNSKSIINEMKSCALNSSGLSTFISRNKDVLKFI